MYTLIGVYFLINMLINYCLLNSLKTIDILFPEEKIFINVIWFHPIITFLMLFVIPTWLLWCLVKIIVEVAGLFASLDFRWIFSKEKGIKLNSDSAVPYGEPNIFNG